MPPLAYIHQCSEFRGLPANSMSKSRSFMYDMAADTMIRLGGCHVGLQLDCVIENYVSYFSVKIVLWVLIETVIFCTQNIMIKRKSKKNTKLSHGM